MAGTSGRAEPSHEKSRDRREGKEWTTGQVTKTAHYIEKDNGIQAAKSPGWNT